jgi:serine/threonine protein phosphatase PrpC
VFAVADGMGGHPAGEVASQLAVDEVRAALGSRSAQRAVEAYVTRADLESRREVFAELRRAVERANQRVRSDANEHEERRGMGTTLDVVWLARDHAFVAHAGDGRVYLARARAMLQITQDHTTAELARAEGHTDLHGFRSGITNAVGLADVIAVDTAFVDVSRGDRLLLCTDGVHAQIDAEGALAELLRTGDASQALNALIGRAADGGRDNATAIVVDIGERFVRRAERDRGLNSADLERARQSPLLVDLPEPFVLSALTAAVEVEVAAGERILRSVASDLVAYIVLDGVVHYPTSGRRLGAGALVYPESLVEVSGSGEAPLAEQTTRLLRLRADDFAEVCADRRLAAQLYRRLAQHLARLSARVV